jgi:hypothetical protein
MRPSLVPDFNQTCTSQGLWVQRLMFESSNCIARPDRDENLFHPHELCPLLPDLNQTCSGCGAWGPSRMSEVWVFPLQCRARYGRTTLSPSRVKCPSLLPDFDQSYSGCGPWCGRFLSHPAAMPCATGTKNWFSLPSKVRFVTALLASPHSAYLRRLPSPRRPCTAACKSSHRHAMPNCVASPRRAGLPGLTSLRLPACLASPRHRATCLPTWPRFASQRLSTSPRRAYLPTWLA